MRRPPALSVEPLEDRIEPSGGITVLPQPPDTRDWAAAYTRLVPDLPYGTTGTTTLTPDPAARVAGQSDTFYSLIQPDGRVIVTLASVTPDSRTVRHEVVRLTADGRIDPTFVGTIPALPTSLPGSGGYAGVDGIAVQPDGKVVIAYTDTPPRIDRDPDPNTPPLYDPDIGSIVRLNADGSLDTTFGTGGVVSLPPGRPDPDTGRSTTFAAAPTVLPDGRILFADYSRLRRLTPDGQPDPTFGSRGVVERTYPGYSRDISLHGPFATQTDGKIVVLASGTNIYAVVGRRPEAVLARLNPDGSPDLGFGTGGAMVLPPDVLAPDGIGGRVSDRFAVGSMQAQPDGRIVLGASTNIALPGTGILASLGGVIRLLPDGSRDPSFGTDGVVALPADFANPSYTTVRVVPQTNGQYLVSRLQIGPGEAYYPALYRLNADGSADATFGRGKSYSGEPVYPTAGQAGALPLAGLANHRTAADPLGTTDAYTDILARMAVLPDGAVLVVQDSRYDPSAGGGPPGEVLRQVTITRLVEHPLPPPRFVGNTQLTGRVGEAVLLDFDAADGSGGPYTFALTDGTLPPGLTVTPDGMIGTPTRVTVPGATFTVTVTDGAGTPASQPFTMRILGRDVTVITADNSSPPDGRPGVAYATAFIVWDRYFDPAVTGPFTFAVTGGALPPGLTLGPDGGLSGVPTAAGGYTFTVTATNAALESGSAEFFMAVIPDPLTIEPAGLPNGRVGRPYRQVFVAAGGPGPFTWSITGGLPPGLTLSPDGVLSGTPTAFGGVSGSVVTVTGPTGRGSEAYTITIDPADDVGNGGNGTRAGGQTLVVSGAGGQAQVYQVGGSGPAAVGGPLAVFTGFAGSVRAATADVDGDGTPDTVLVTGPGVPIRYAVVSGADNATVLVPPTDPFGGDFTGGGFVAAANIDGQGGAEWAVTPDQGGGPRVTIFSLTNGQLATRANFFGIDDAGFRGGARAALGDVNNDGTPDLAVSAGFLGGPRTALFDGKTVLGGTPARLVNDFFAFNGPDAVTLRNGVFVAAGDLDGDGFGELVFGGGPGGAPRVFALSGKMISAGDVAGAQANPVSNFFVAGNTSDRGGVRVGAADADADGKADLVAGSGAGSPARVRVYLGKHLTSAAEPGTAQDLAPFGGAVLADGVYVG
ncbi:MAG: putative Ig domain-containing protein [Gemmataceae bacterium]|nr:putative Ig domain-containing protein [Gemmataceae bacterium]